MRRLVTVLRDENADAAERGPAPGLSDLHTLVAGVVDGRGDRRRPDRR